MADEQAPAEVTASVETPEQTPAVSEAPAPAVDTPTTPETPTEPDRGDPRIAMQEERRKRQELERNAQDPHWIYEQARRLGLAQDETPSAAPQATPQYQQPDVASIVEHQLDYLRAVEKHPEFDRDKGDQALVKWAATLVNDGHKPSEAIDIILKTIEKQALKQSKAEVQSTLESRAVAEAQKLQADAITSTATANPDDAEIEEINARARNWKDPVSQQNAILEKLKRGIR